MDITTYKISDNQYLKIHLDESIDEDECQFCTWMDIDYVDDKNNVCIRFGYEEVDEFYAFLAESERIQKLLKGEMILSSKINDLGFEYNQFTAGKQPFNKAFLEYFWFNNSYKKIRPFYTSWLYNDQEGNIVFEITPFYSWFNVTKKTHPDKISYKKWIENYKPIIKTIIPKENIKQWIKQAEELAEIYKLNLNYSK